MRSQIGERYRCSDPDCGCEIEVKTASNSSRGNIVESTGNRRAGVAPADETGAGLLRNAESGGISTPGDFGSQGATGEGVFGTSGGNQRSTMSGRLGSLAGAFKSDRADSSAVNLDSGDSIAAETSNDEGRSIVGYEDEGFSCCCGQPMVRSGAAERGLGRAAGASPVSY
jgi:hypothetical protein